MTGKPYCPPLPPIPLKGTPDCRLWRPGPAGAAAARAAWVSRLRLGPRQFFATIEERRLSYCQRVCLVLIRFTGAPSEYANAAAASANAAAAAAGSVTMLSEDVRLPASIQPQAGRHRSPGPARPGPQSPRPTDGPVPAAGPLTPDAGGGGGDAGGAGGALIDTLRRPEVAGYGAAWPASESRFAVPRVSARLPSKQERRAGSSVGCGSHEAAEQARTTPRSGQPPSPRCGGGFGGAGAARQGRQVGGLQAVSESQPQGEAQDPAPSAASALSHSCPVIPTVQI